MRLLIITWMLLCFFYHSLVAQVKENCDSLYFADTWNAVNEAYSDFDAEYLKLLESIVVCKNRIDADDELFHNIVGAKAYIADYYEETGKVVLFNKTLLSLDGDFDKVNHWSSQLKIYKKFQLFLWGNYYFDQSLLELSAEKYDLVIEELLVDLEYSEKGYLDEELIWNFIYFPALDLFNNAANAYSKIGDNEKANQYYRISYSLLEKSDASWQKAMVLQNLAFTYMQIGAYEKAASHFKKAEKILIHYDNSNAINSLATTYENMGENYFYQNKLDSARNCFEQLHHLEMKPVTTINALQAWSKFLISTNQLNDASNKLTQLESITVSHLGMDHIEYAELLLLKVNLNQELKQEDSSDSLLTAAFRILSGQNSVNCNDVDVSRLNYKRLALDIVSRHANLMANQRNETCFDCFNLARRIIEELNVTHIVSEYSKYDLAKTAKSIYSGAVEAFLDFGNIEQAYNYAKEAKAMVLLQNLRDKDAIDAGLVPKQELGQGRLLKIKLNELKKEKEQILQNENQSLSEISLAIVNAQNDYTNWINDMEDEYPLFYKYKYGSSKKGNLKSLQSNLGTNESIVEYFLLEEELLVFVINKDSINLKSKKIGDDFFDDIKIMNDHVNTISYTYKEYASFVEVSNRLYGYLLEPLIAQDLLKRNLIIIPDEEIALVPFDALIDQKKIDGQSIAYQDQHYILDEFNISYYYSSELIKKRKRKASGFKFLGLAPDFENRDIPVLDYNGYEINTIAENLNGTALLGSEASYESFSKNYKNHNVIHFSTHGVFNDSMPLISHVSVADRPIYIYEFGALDHTFDLVVLSACETASGVNKKGEGLLSLSRALIQSGCPTVVSNLWEVSDQKTSMQMIDFYDFVQSKYDSREALNMAKRKYLKSTVTKNTHPFYWAGLIHIGDPYKVKYRVFQGIDFSSFAIWLVLFCIGFLLIYLVITSIKT